MNLLESIVSSPGAVRQLGARVGLSESQTRSALEALLPALSSGLMRNTAQPGGLDSLIAALNQGDHAKYLEVPSELNGAARLRRATASWATCSATRLGAAVWRSELQSRQALAMQF